MDEEAWTSPRAVQRIPSLRFCSSVHLRKLLLLHKHWRCECLAPERHMACLVSWISDKLDPDGIHGKLRVCGKGPVVRPDPWQVSAHSRSRPCVQREAETVVDRVRRFSGVGGGNLHVLSSLMRQRHTTTPFLTSQPPIPATTKRYVPLTCITRSKKKTEEDPATLFSFKDGVLARICVMALTT